LKDGRTALIRLSRPEDVESEIELQNSIGAEGIYITEDKVTWTADEARKVRAKAEPGSTLHLAAEIDGRLVGCIVLGRGLWPKNRHTASFAIYVHREFRSLGVGEAIMRAGIDWARGVGIKKMLLGVFATNDRAIGLYRKLGFVEEGRFKGDVMIKGVPVDKIIMSLWL
jgi:RimJ/RimL family protein N-acetyltransferase